MKKKITIFYLLLSFVLFITSIHVDAVNSNETERNVISFAVDVSGSMKKTDTDKDIIQMIQMFIDSCDEGDFVSVTAYNDKIVYNSGLVEINHDSEKKLIDTLAELQYGGDTDNGLGLITAVTNICDSNIEFNKKIVMMVGDGDTDIPAESDRTFEDSTEDIMRSGELADNNNVVIYTVEFGEKCLRDTSNFSVIASQTGGGNSLVKDLPEYLLVMMNTFYSSYHNGKTEFKIEKTSEAIQRKEFETSNSDEYFYNDIIFSMSPIKDAEVIDKNGRRDYIKGSNYIVIKDIGQIDENVTAIYTLEQNNVVISGRVKRLIPPKEEVIIPTEEPKVEPKEEPVITPEPQKDYSGLISAVVIVIILVVTVWICIFIIKKFLGQKKVPSLQGYLCLKFINLKSKNESVDICWNLADFSPAGVTLEELFEQANLKEEFKDTQKVNFYPSKNSNELIFVHCADGGIFKEDKIVKQNISVTIRDNDVLFFSFDENTSEFSLTYHRDML